MFAIGLLSYALDQLQVDGDASILGKAAVGLPGAGNILLDLKSERNWVFRQRLNGAETALKLAVLAASAGSWQDSVSLNVRIDLSVESPE